jgi:hypothetical protein
MVIIACAVHLDDNINTDYSWCVRVAVGITVPAIRSRIGVAGCLDGVVDVLLVSLHWRFRGAA